MSGNRLWPYPTIGMPAVQDHVSASASGNWMLELSDRVLVKKPIGKPESPLAVQLMACRMEYLKPSCIGNLQVPDNMPDSPLAAMRAGWPPGAPR